MYIRELHQDELWWCIRFGHAFHEEKSVITDDFDPDAFMKNWRLFYQTNIGIVFGLFEDNHNLIGGIGGVVADDLTSGKMKASELFWYVDREKRHCSGRWPLRLVSRFREWGKEKLAGKLRMVRLFGPKEDIDDARLDPIYTDILKLYPVEIGFEGDI